jgi:hypothetical protein
MHVHGQRYAIVRHVVAAAEEAREESAFVKMTWFRLRAPSAQYSMQPAWCSGSPSAASARP